MAVTTSNSEKQFNHAIEHYLSGRYSSAESKCKKLLAKHPQFAECHNLLGSVYHKQERLELAVKEVKHSLKLNPDYVDAWYNLGTIYSDSKEYGQARECFERVIAMIPQHAEAYFGLGNALRDEGDQLDAAVEMYNKAIELNPNYADAYNNLGQIRFDEQQLETAQELYQKTISLDNRHPAAHFNLGRLANIQRRWEQALEHHKQAISLKPDYAEVHVDMASAFESQDMITRAVAAYEQALKIKPDLIEAHIRLGSLKQGINKEEALSHLQQSLKINPESSEVHNAFAQFYSENDEREQAITSHEETIKLSPKAAKYYVTYANSLERYGELDKAKEILRKAIDIAPDTASSAYKSLVFLERFKEPNEITKHMEVLLESSKASETEKMELSLGLSRVYESSGDYDKAFSYLKRANDTKRLYLSYDSKLFENEIKQIKDTALQFAKQKRDTASQENNDITPVFILGMPRSGTTLVEQILASHPLVTGAGELKIMGQVLNSQTKQKDVKIIYENLTLDKLPAVGEEYINQLKSHAKGNPYITDKMPHNFIHIAAIRYALPQAKIIHCNRHPMDNSLAIYKQIFTQGHHYGYTLEELGEYHRHYQELMDFWRDLFPGEFYDIHYEELVTDQENQTRKLLEFCGLEWDENCLDFHKTKRQVKTASVAQVRQPMYTSSVALWEKYGDNLTPLKKILGY